MPVIALTDAVSTPATRRRVLKTGVKIAYAAPLVAASFKLSAAGVAAGAVISGEGCGADVNTGLFVVNCTSTGQLCSPTFDVSVCTLTGALVAQYTTHPNHCSDVLVQFFVDGVPASGLIGPLGPVSGITTTGPVPVPTTPGSHTVSIQATGVVGGCNGGVLSGWGGTLAIDVN